MEGQGSRSLRPGLLIWVFCASLYKCLSAAGPAMRAPLVWRREAGDTGGGSSRILLQSDLVTPIPPHLLQGRTGAPKSRGRWQGGLSREAASRSAVSWLEVGRAHREHIPPHTCLALNRPYTSSRLVCSKCSCTQVRGGTVSLVRGFRVPPWCRHAACVTAQSCQFASKRAMLLAHVTVVVARHAGRGTPLGFRSTPAPSHSLLGLRWVGY